MKLSTEAMQVLTKSNEVKNTSCGYSIQIHKILTNLPPNYHQVLIQSELKQMHGNQKKLIKQLQQFIEALRDFGCQMLQFEEQIKAEVDDFLDGFHTEQKVIF